MGVTHKIWQEKSRSEETKQSFELDENRTQILKLSYREFKITIIKTLTDLMEKIGNMQA